MCNIWIRLGNRCKICNRYVLRGANEWSGIGCWYFLAVNANQNKVMGKEEIRRSPKTRRVDADDDGWQMAKILHYQRKYPPAERRKDQKVGQLLNDASGKCLY